MGQSNIIFPHAIDDKFVLVGGWSQTKFNLERPDKWLNIHLSGRLPFFILFVHLLLDLPLAKRAAKVNFFTTVLPKGIL